MSTDVGLIISSGKAYLPTMARSERHRLWVEQEPVLVTDLSAESLVNAIARKLAEGNPTVALPEDEAELRRWWKRTTGQNCVVLKAAKATSWREFTRKARAYDIMWTTEKTILDMSKPFLRGAFEWDPDKTKEFPPDIPLPTIVSEILRDVYSIPEIMAI